MFRPQVQPRRLPIPIEPAAQSSAQLSWRQNLAWLRSVWSEKTQKSPNGRTCTDFIAILKARQSPMCMKWLDFNPFVTFPPIFHPIDTIPRKASNHIIFNLGSESNGESYICSRMFLGSRGHLPADSGRDLHPRRLYRRADREPDVQGSLHRP